MSQPDSVEEWIAERAQEAAPPFVVFEPGSRGLDSGSGNDSAERPEAPRGRTGVAAAGFVRSVCGAFSG